MKKIKFLFLTICLGMLSPAGMSSLYAQCPTGTDIHIANDISGSVDSREFQQSIKFDAEIDTLFDNKIELLTTEFRISIGKKSNGNGLFLGGYFFLAQKLI